MKYTDFLGLETTPERPQFPVVIEAVYELSDDGQSALLSLRGSNARSLAITIVHESVACTKHDMAGNEACDRLRIHNGEGLIVLARRNGDVVACGLYQINLGAYESIGSVLIPVAVSNLEVMQSDAQMVARILQRTLDSLENLEDTQKVEAVR